MNFDAYCIYMAGFDRLGRHLYGSWWTGNEYLADPVEPPESVEVKRRELLKEIDKALSEINEVRKERRTSILSYEQSSLLDQRYDQASQRNKELNLELAALPHDMDDQSAKYEEYQRRLVVEELLTDSLESGQILLWVGLSPAGYRWSEWGNRDGYVLFRELSVLRTPNLGRQRRVPVFFKISELDTWFESLEPFNSENREPLSTEDQYRELIRDCYASLNGRVPKTYFRNFVKKNCSGTFQVRTFDRAWANEDTIPNEWKKGGNIPKSKRHRD